MSCCEGGSQKLPDGYDPSKEPDPKFSADYDYAFIINKDAGNWLSFSSKNKKAQKAEDLAAEMISKLKKAHLNVFAYESGTGKEIILLVGIKYNTESWQKQLLSNSDIASSAIDAVDSKPISALHVFADLIGNISRLDFAHYLTTIYINRFFFNCEYRLAYAA
jgi:hypothetical protein